MVVRLSKQSTFLCENDFGNQIELYIIISLNDRTHSSMKCAVHHRMYLSGIYVSIWLTTDLYDSPNIHSLRPRDAYMRR